MSRNIAALGALLVLVISAGAFAQRTVTISGDRLSGFVLPVEPLHADIHVEALRARAWTVDDTKRLLLEGNVLITIGQHQFDANGATVWLNRIPSEEGLINQFALFLDRTRSPRARSGLGVSGEHVLVTGSARGAVTMDVALLEGQRAATEPLVRRGEQRLAEYLKRLLAERQSLRRYPQVQSPGLEQQPFVPQPGGDVTEQQMELPETVTLPETEAELPSLFEPQGVVRVAAERIELTPGEDENIVTATGGLVVEYLGTDPDAKWSRLSLTAERAVVFLDPATLDELTTREFDAEQVRGMYLEGNVVAMADEGRYTVRAPKIYYDFTTGRALMVNSILRTYSRLLDAPVYARAQEMRQLAANQWDAKKVRVSTSEFYTPHLSLGAETVTVTQRPSPTDATTDELYVDSRDNTVRIGDTPVVWFPRFSGTSKDTPLRSVQAGTEENDGLRVLTSWDFFALAGAKQPEGVDAELKLDGFSKRGVAVGVDLDYNVADAHGNVDLYAMTDDGVDRTSSGRDVDRGHRFRGVALWENQLEFAQYWNLQTQASYISDPTFITTWREDDFEQRREYETAFYLKRQENNSALTFLAKYELNDFISNSYLLASRQYQVDRLPELTYRRIGDSFWDDRLTYTSSYQWSHLRFAFEENTPEELGVRARAFGIDDDTPMSDALAARGLTEGWVNRLDTRHELSMPMQSGIFKVVPFVMGRATGYDDDFDNFSSDSDDLRLFGAAGVRISTQFQRVHNDVESRLFNLHRLRHIIEPSVTAWYGHSTVDQSDLPTYDERVESLADGVAVRFGVRNVWQTQRGGPGRWRSVDVFTFDNDVVLHSGDIDRESPTPQFFDYRPEYSQFGDHWRTRLVWQFSDHFTLQGESTVDLEESAIARGSFGAEIRHSPVFRSYIEYRYFDINNLQLLDLRWQYELTPVYLVDIRPQWDFNRDTFRALSVRVTRRFPDFDFTVQVRRDEIRKDTTVGASLDVASF